MAKPWNEVESSSEYQNLSDTEKQELRLEYFDNVVKKNPVYLNLPPEEKIPYEESFIGYSPTKEREFTTSKTFEREQGILKRHNLIPSIGQFVGGMGGFVGGGALGHPYLGSIAGGTAGRMAGRGIQELVDIPARMRLEKEGIKLPSRGGKILEELGTTLATETVTAPLAFGLGKLGQGIIKTFIPRTVAERGIKSGFKPMLKSEYYEEGLPKQFVNKIYTFFSNARNKYGQAINNILDKPQYRKFRIDINAIKDSLRASLKSIGIDSVQDIQKLDISSRDKEILMREARNILNLTKEKSIPINLWNARKELDKVVYGKSWKPEAQEVIDRLRGVVNNPLRNLSKEVAGAFDDYSTLMSRSNILDFADDIVKFKTSGEAFTMPKSEQFVKTIMSPEKSGLREFLHRIDPAFSEELFDISSAKILGKQFIPGSAYQTVFGRFVNPKLIAGGAANLQRPNVQFIKGIGGRLIPTTAANLLTEEE